MQTSLICTPLDSFFEDGGGGSLTALLPLRSLDGYFLRFQFARSIRWTRKLLSKGNVFETFDVGLFFNYNDRGIISIRDKLVMK